MSQEKVDRYKQEKANRQKIMKREKIRTRLSILAATVVMVGLIGWFSAAVYQNAKATSAANTSAETITLDTSDVDTYLSDLAQEYAAE
ncbi:MAG: hypothetical protein Q4B03_09280 [Lachnospiraceae bacterium]|nr:hypothetical protein [Lachnospiraceae bacterium]